MLKLCCQDQMPSDYGCSQLESCFMGMNSFYDSPKKAIKIQRELHTRLLLIIVVLREEEYSPVRCMSAFVLFLTWKSWQLGSRRTTTVGCCSFLSGNICAGIHGSLLGFDCGTLSAHTPTELLHYGFWRPEKQTYLCATVIEPVEAPGINSN